MKIKTKVKRPSKTDYYLSIAKTVSQRSTCCRRRFGAVIVKEDQIVSTGYVGAPRGALNCIDLKQCPRQELQIPAGQRYELCRSVHAEANTVINAARAGVSVLGGTLYLYGENIDGSLIENVMPCQMCRRIIINSGIEKVVVLSKEGTKEFNSKDWLNSKDISLEGY